MPSLTARVIVVVEGHNDTQFLRRIATVLIRDGLSVPDLDAMEQRGELVFMPIGGGNLAAWATRLAPLGLPEFHLFDRELSPETEIRQAVVDDINQRAGCQAVLTSKRSLENYLHPQAVQAALGITLDFDDDAPVADLIARSCHLQTVRETQWDLMPLRIRKWLSYRAKRWPNTRAVSQMTAELLAERDPRGEVLHWLDTIRRLAAGQTDFSIPKRL